MKKKLSVLLLLFSFICCGKKGPLKPPPDLTLHEKAKTADKIKVKPPKAISCQVLETKGAVAITIEAVDCEKFRIYRYIKGNKRALYAVTEKNYFVDDFPLLNIAVIYEATCVVKDVESEDNPVAEVIFK